MSARQVVLLKGCFKLKLGSRVRVWDFASYAISRALISRAFFYASEFFRVQVFRVGDPSERASLEVVFPLKDSPFGVPSEFNLT